MDAAQIDFPRDIQPVFTQHCISCHGPQKQKGGLRLDVKADALAVLDSGERAIAPGKPRDSAMLRLVREDEPGEVMPPKGDKLSKRQIDLLTRWIEQGADWPDSASAKRVVKSDHWAYQPIERPPVPAPPPVVENSKWVRNEIDRFVLAKLEAAGVAPSPAADRYTLIKRLHYDLLGLPPTPDEVDAFVKDDSPHAYEKLVDRLLASQHFGERWGRHWLDKARYADSDGYEKDNPRPNAWRYRGWVIDAVNADMPFDQFTIEQLAGDLLASDPPASQGGVRGGSDQANTKTDHFRDGADGDADRPTLPQPLPVKEGSAAHWQARSPQQQRLATAFHRQTLTNTEGGTDQEEFRIEATFDRTETTGTVWLGLTVTCARCHTHKYDPITQRDYYELFAFFNAGNEANMDLPTSADAMAKYETQKKAHDEHVAKLENRLADAKEQVASKVGPWEQDIKARLATVGDNEIRFHAVKIVSAKAKHQGVKLAAQKDGSLLAEGPTPDVDEYTIVLKTPLAEVTGLRIETMTDSKLPSNGPGRTGHGNFVLSELRAYAADEAGFKRSAEKLGFAKATADFAQDGFPPGNALKNEARTGWAISPRMGKDHQITATFEQPAKLGEGRFMQVVLDQSYGGRHTIGKFRITAMTGYDPGLNLPAPVAAALKVEPAKRDAKQEQALLDHVASLDADVKKTADELDKLKKAAPKPPVMAVRIMAQGSRKTHMLHRGDFLSPTDPVEADVLSVLRNVRPLKSRDEKTPPDRLDLARWLVHPDNPLTPRVTVNHVWAHLFGRGIVGTVNDFGVRGEPPTHPKLLDWLARHFVDDLKWSRKRLVRTIVLSATYRQSSHHRPELAQTDASNQLLHRQNRLRVEAEIVRDLHLASSGLLSRKVGGPSVFPPLPPGVAELSYANNFKWQTSEGEDRYRRGMYTFFKRTSPHPNLTSFDCPDSNTTKAQRDTSNTPLQALTTLNNEVFVEASQHMARRVLTEAEGDAAARLRYGMRLAITRVPRSEEVSRFLDVLEASRAYYVKNPDDAKKLIGAHAAAGVPPHENAAWVATMRMVMNLDEFIVRD